MMSFGAGASGWLWMLAGLALVAGVVLVIIWAAQLGGRGSEDESLRALRVRFARGEIAAAQFEEMRRLLESSEAPRAPHRVGLIRARAHRLRPPRRHPRQLARTGGLGWMMGPGGMLGGAWTEDQPGPGSPGFVAGTASAPRLVRILAGSGSTFSPSEVRIVAGETITFEVTTMGPTVHEFKVGPAAQVAADSDAAPEIADIGMMATRSLTSTFAGSAPFAFACHEPGHYEAGMRGVITVVS